MRFGVLERGFGHVCAREVKRAPLHPALERDHRQAQFERGQDDRHAADLGFDDHGLTDVLQHERGGRTVVGPLPLPIVRQTAVAARSSSGCVSLVTAAEGADCIMGLVSHLIELFYSDHCLACPEAREVVRQFALERPDVVLVEHDVAVEVDQARGYHLIATPALVIDGGTVMYGVPRPAALAARVDKNATDAADESRR